MKKSYLNYYYRQFGPPRDGLILYAKNSVDSIGLSVDDYDNIGATWQAIFFTDSDTPIVFDDFDALWTAVSAESTLNDENVMGTEDKGVAVYDESTSRYTLNKALRFFGLTEVEPTVADRYSNTDHYTNVEHYT